jgi:hypothetical protein
MRQTSVSQMKAIASPAGAQAGSAAQNGPLVSGVACEPSELIT